MELAEQWCGNLQTIRARGGCSFLPLCAGEPHAFLRQHRRDHRFETRVVGIYSDESVRVYLATGLTDVGRPDAHDEEADLTLRWLPLDEAVRMVINGEIVNSLAVGGILAAHTVTDRAALRPVDAPWTDRPTAFARRKGH